MAGPPAWQSAPRPSPRRPRRPIIAKPRMRSLSAATSAFMKPLVSPIVRVRNTALIGSFAIRTAMPWRCASPFVQPDPSERRVREHAVGNQPVARTAAHSGQIVPNDPEIVERHVRELRAAGALADRPDIGRTCFQPFIDRDVAATVQRDTGHVEPDPRGVGNAPGRRQNVAALDGPLPDGVRTTRRTVCPERPCTSSTSAETTMSMPSSPRMLSDLFRHVGVLAPGELRSVLDDGHAAAEAAVGLRQFEADIAAAEHDQMRRQIVEFQRLDIRQRPGGIEAGNVWYRRMGSDIEEHLIAGQHARRRRRSAARRASSAQRIFPRP